MAATTLGLGGILPLPVLDSFHSLVGAARPENATGQPFRASSGQIAEVVVCETAIIGDHLPGDITYFGSPCCHNISQLR